MSWKVLETALSHLSACLCKLLYVFFVCIFRCYDRSGINSSGGMQCRRLSIWSVYFSFNTLSCQNYFSHRVLGGGGVHKTCGNSGGCGVIFVFKKWIFRGGGGTCVKFPLCWGMDIFWKYTIPKAWEGFSSELSEFPEVRRQKLGLKSLTF